MTDKRNCGCDKCQIIFGMREHQEDLDNDKVLRDEASQEFLEGFETGVSVRQQWTLRKDVSKARTSGYYLGQLFQDFARKAAAQQTPSDLEVSEEWETFRAYSLSQGVDFDDLVVKASEIVAHDSPDRPVIWSEESIAAFLADTEDFDHV